MAWQRANNMSRLRADALTVWPGMTIYDIGDLAHARGRSGHNPDDMVLPEGGSAELSDPDGKQEVRALDFMLGPRFTAADAEDLVAALRDARSRGRLYYVIYNRRIYRRDGSDSAYTGSNPHTDHVHASGWWEDDENTSPWSAVLEIGDDMTRDELREDLARMLQALTYGTNTVFSTAAHPWLAGAITLPKLAAELRLSHAALLAAVQGDGDKDAIVAHIDQRAAELVAGQQALKAELAADLAPALVAVLREELADLPAEHLERVLERVRVTVEPAPAEG